SDQQNYPCSPRSKDRAPPHRPGGEAVFRSAEVIRSWSVGCRRCRLESLRTVEPGDIGWAMTAVDWEFEVPTSGTTYLPHDSRYMDALTSQGYGFEAAIADLIDNSIDAGAHDVVVHFLRDGDRLVSLLIIDDGQGMTEEQLDVAMTVGGRRGYAADALGMFGTGLKSASLSQAGAVTVVSRTRRTRPVGRRWVMERARDGFQCDIVDLAYAQTLVDRYHGCPITWQGTVVRWDAVKNFPQHGGGGQTDRYLHRTINKLGLHLGLQLHRFLLREDFNITIAVEDIRTGDV